MAKDELYEDGLGNKTRRFPRVQLDFSKGKSMTIASHAVGLSVAEIVSKFRMTGQMPSRQVPGVFMDASVIPGVFENLNLKVKLDQYFSSLPADLREKFSNSSLELGKWLANPANRDEAIRFGFLAKPEDKAAAAAATEAAALDKEVKKARAVRDALAKDVPPK